MNKSVIAGNFGRAAGSYAGQAPVQKLCAAMVADCLGGRAVGSGLEIGCGTGFLTRHLLERHPRTTWTISDISPEMLETCQANLVSPHEVTFKVMDGQHPELPDPVDLIISNLAFQWFTDLGESITNLYARLAPGGRLVFSTFGPGTFREWRLTVEALGRASGLHEYPSAEALQRMAPQGAQVAIKQHLHVQPYASGRAFLQALKGIGAQAPRVGYSPLSPGHMRKVLASLDQEECRMTYDLMIIQITKGN